MTGLSCAQFSRESGVLSGLFFRSPRISFPSCAGVLQEGKVARPGPRRMDLGRRGIEPHQAATPDFDWIYSLLATALTPRTIWVPESRWIFLFAAESMPDADPEASPASITPGIAVA